MTLGEIYKIFELAQKTDMCPWERSFRVLSEGLMMGPTLGKQERKGRCPGVLAGFALLLVGQALLLGGGLRRLVLACRLAFVFGLFWSGAFSFCGGGVSVFFGLRKIPPRASRSSSMWRGTFGHRDTFTQRPMAKPIFNSQPSCDLRGAAVVAHIRTRGEVLRHLSSVLLFWTAAGPCGQ